MRHIYRLMWRPESRCGRCIITHKREDISGPVEDDGFYAVVRNDPPHRVSLGCAKLTEALRGVEANGLRPVYTSRRARRRERFSATGSSSSFVLRSSLALVLASRCSARAFALAAAMTLTTSSKMPAARRA